MSSAFFAPEARNSSLYLISGLVVRSEVKLPSAILAAHHGPVPDIEIRAGHVPAHLPAPLHSGETWETQKGLFLVRIRGIGNFLIGNEREIIFDLVPGCEPRAAALCLLGTCFAVLLQQRGNLVLHASAISVGGQAVLFCGQSGAGKSTMAAMLCRRGYALLNDDVCNLVPAGDDAYEVCPDGRMLKLWRESLEHLEWDSQPEMVIRADMEKYFFAPPASEALPQPVGAVYVLREAPPGKANTIAKLRAIDGMNELRRNAYRPALVAAMELEQDYFRASAAIQRSAGIYALSRQLDFNCADSLLDLLEEHWSTLSDAIPIGASQ